jgi:hypothetical protein
MKEERIDPKIIATNRRFDKKYSHFLEPSARIRSAWSESKLMVQGKITDRKIAQYRSQGLYSGETRKARAAYQVRKRSFGW